jgi:hypothetical protein
VTLYQAFLVHSRCQQAVGAVDIRSIRTPSSGGRGALGIKQQPSIGPKWP